MRQLSHFDAQFLTAENATTLAHIGVLAVLDPSDVPGGRLSLDEVRAVLEPRLHLAPVLRQRLVTVPLNLAPPYWVDDPDFDIEFHLRELGLPEPGGEAALAEKLSQLHSRPLDRTRPLWELYLIDGLGDGKQAVYAKIHHAAVDGVAAVDLLSTLLDPTPEPWEVDPEDPLWDPAPAPEWPEMAGRGVLTAASQPLQTALRLPRTLPHLMSYPGMSLVPFAGALSDLAGALMRTVTGGPPEDPVNQRASGPDSPIAEGPTPEGTVQTPPTRLNGRITAHRRLAFVTLPMEQVDQVRDAWGATVNDVVLALTASVLRRWMLTHDALPEEPLVAAVPVAVHTEDPGSDDGSANQVSVILVSLPTDVADPDERLAAVAHAMSRQKARFSDAAATILHDVAASVPTVLTGLAAKAATRLVTSAGPAFNLLVSNLHGPRESQYLAGARVEGLFPLSAVSDLTGALTVSVLSYDGSLYVGLVACREIVPDVDTLPELFRDALAEWDALEEEPG